MTDRQPAKRIPKSLGTETTVLGGYTISDAAVGLFPGVVLVLLTQVLLPDTIRVAGYSPQTFTLPLAAIAILVGAIFVYLTPTYTTSLEWLLSMCRFQFAATHETPETAPEHTQVERVYPEQDVIERQNGAFIGLVQVSSPPMALATEEEWQSKAHAFQDFLNTSVTFPIQIFSTTQPFPVDTYLDRYRSRQSDPDVEANPKLDALIENYIEWYERDLQARQMTIRDHYVIVSVTPDEVQFARGSVLDKLRILPVIGFLVRGWTAPPLAEQRAAMFDRLAERMNAVETGIRGIDDCHATAVDAATATTVVAEYWAGETVEYGDIEETLRTSPIVGDPA